MISAPPGWYPDPWRNAPLRYWDSYSWTPYVTQPPPAAARPANPTFPLRAALASVVGLALALIGLYALADTLASLHLPGLSYVAILVTLQYSAMTALCLFACFRWATGNPVVDLGLRVKAVDVAWGPVGWIAAMASAALVTVAATSAGVPFTSNNPFAGTESSNSGSGLDLHQGSGLALLGFVMIVCAPVFEEALFRGVLLRGLRSRLPAPAAIGLQGVAFGAFHFDPSRGAGNIGLILALSTGGIVLGIMAERTGRLAPGMIAHALQNGMAFGLGLLVTGA